MTVHCPPKGIGRIAGILHKFGGQFIFREGDVKTHFVGGEMYISPESLQIQVGTELIDISTSEGCTIEELESYIKMLSL